MTEIGESQRRRLANKVAEASPFEDMQQKLRDSGARQNPDGSYETNQGKVVLELPTEARRRGIMETSDKTRKSYFGYAYNAETHAAAKKLAKDKTLDIDWGPYAQKEEENVEPTQADPGSGRDADRGPGDRSPEQPDEGEPDRANSARG